MRVYRGIESRADAERREERERASVSWHPLAFRGPLRPPFSVNPTPDSLPMDLISQEREGLLREDTAGWPFGDDSGALVKAIHAALMDDLRDVCMSAFRETFRG